MVVYCFVKVMGLDASFCFEAEFHIAQDGLELYVQWFC